MSRLLAVTSAGAATLGLTLLGLPPASAVPDVHSMPTTQTQALRAIGPKATVEATSAATSTALSAAACEFPTIMFKGDSYCPASIGAVRGTSYGIGTRVVVNAVTVTTVTPSTVTVAAWVAHPCPPGKFCGAGFTLDALAVPWSGTSRPAYGDVLNLFGVTTPTSIRPVGYIKTGFCPIDWC